MAEQTLSELVMNLINWIEWLHEKNLKYEGEVETLRRDLASAEATNKVLEDRLSRFQHTDIKNTVATVPVANINSNPINNSIHPQHQVTVYQPIVNQPAFVSQPAPYGYYEQNGHEMQQPYYEHHYGAQTFQQPQI